MLTESKKTQNPTIITQIPNPQSQIPFTPPLNSQSREKLDINITKTLRNDTNMQ